MTINAGAGNDEIYNDGSKATINAGAGDDHISNYADFVSLSGGADNDSIYNYGNDSTINGGKGNDIFYYASGDGKDIINGFDDLLKITGTFSATYSKSKNEVYFKVGTTSKAITLSDFTATSFRVNDDTYKISGSKLVKK